jgi:hypothetical protein
MRKLAGFAALVAAPIVFGAAAAAQEEPYPPGAPTLTLSPSTVAPGGTFGATLTGCSLGDVVTVSLVSDSASATCSGGGGGSARGIMQEPGGTASVTLTAPTDPGTYTVTATAPGVSATATLTVAVPAAPAPAPAAPPGALPVTGSDSGVPIAQIAAGVLLAGAGLVAVATYRRRRSATPA